MLAKYPLSIRKREYVRVDRSQRYKTMLLPMSPKSEQVWHRPGKEKKRKKGKDVGLLRLARTVLSQWDFDNMYSKNHSGFAHSCQFQWAPLYIQHLVIPFFPLYICACFSQGNFFTFIISFLFLSFLSFFFSLGSGLVCFFFSWVLVVGLFWGIKKVKAFRERERDGKG